MSTSPDHGEIAEAVARLRMQHAALVARRERDAGICAAIEAELATLIAAADTLAQHRARAEKLFSETQP